MRVGLSPTSSSVTSECGNAAAAAAQNAADEASPGTLRLAPRSRCPPHTVIAPSSRSSSMLNTGNARSVWSRVACRSLTVVSPVAWSPASSIAVLTCALATGGVKSMPRNAAPRMAIGGRSSSPLRLAPMSDSGSMIRRIGRRRKDRSPVTILSNGWPASTPDSSRSVVPELPASSVSVGGVRPPMPRPWMVTTPGSRPPLGAACGPSTSTPQRRETGERRRAVRPGSVARDRRWAVCQRGEERVPMGDGLVAWNGDVTAHTPGRTNDNRRHLSTIAVRDEPAAFDERCIPPGCVASRSNTALLVSPRLRHPGTGGMLQTMAGPPRDARRVGPVDTCRVQGGTQSRRDAPPGERY